MGDRPSVRRLYRAAGRTTGSGGTLGGYGSVTGAVSNSGVIAAGSATPGSRSSPTGTFTIIGNLLNQGVIQLASGESIGNVLEVRGSYVGAGGTMAINTFLGGDGSPSDRLVVNGDPAATGNTIGARDQCRRPGCGNDRQRHSGRERGRRGHTAPGRVHARAGELRGGRFRLRSVPGRRVGQRQRLVPALELRRAAAGRSPVPVPSDPTVPARPAAGPAAARRPFRSLGRNSPPMGWCSLWRANWVSRSSARSTTGSATPTSRTVRRGACAPRRVDLPTRKSGAAARRRARFFALGLGPLLRQTINNHYQAFADPRASGNLGGFQGGIDLLRGSLIAGHYERAGLYGAYGDVNADVNGLVTNPAATAYILNHTDR